MHVRPTQGAKQLQRHTTAEIGNSIAFGKAPRREADSQPISQSVRQAVSQAVGRASRQADRQAETYSLAFFPLLHLQTVGVHRYARPIGDRVVEHSHSDSKVVDSNPDWRSPARVDQAIVLFHPTHVQILLSTNF